MLCFESSSAGPWLKTLAPTIATAIVEAQKSAKVGPSKHAHRQASTTFGTSRSILLSQASSYGKARDVYAPLATHPTRVKPSLLEPSVIL
jgi:hypothetical protein